MLVLRRIEGTLHPAEMRHLFVPLLTLRCWLETEPIQDIRWALDDLLPLLRTEASCAALTLAAVYVLGL